MKLILDEILAVMGWTVEFVQSLFDAVSFALEWISHRIRNIRWRLKQ